MILYGDLLAVALVISAFLALHFENVTYAVISFGIMFVVLSGFYFSLNAPFAAVFQLVVAVGTVAVFFLAGEMLTLKKASRQGFGNKILGVIIALGLAVPSIVFHLEVNTLMQPNTLSFPYALWKFRALDVVAQGVVILTLALGAVLVLKERRNQKIQKKQVKGG